MYKVLVIDDDKLARKGIISIVPWAQCGLEVVGDAANGALALEFIEQYGEIPNSDDYPYEDEIIRLQRSIG